MLKGFEPIVSNDARILILGSMPSITSLEKQEYYGYKHNRFWKIMQSYFTQELNSYDDKIQLIKQHHFVLWDVIKYCERKGSLDSNIRNEVCNDISELLHNNPNIRYVLCNGRKSYDLYQKYFKHETITCICLPSTSNANRSMKEEELIRIWFDTFDRLIHK